MQQSTNKARNGELKSEFCCKNKLAAEKGSSLIRKSLDKLWRKVQRRRLLVARRVFASESEIRHSLMAFLACGGQKSARCRTLDARPASNKLLPSAKSRRTALKEKLKTRKANKEASQECAKAKKNASVKQMEKENFSRAKQIATFVAKCALFSIFACFFRLLYFVRQQNNKQLASKLQKPRRNFIVAATLEFEREFEFSSICVRANKCSPPKRSV